MLSCGVWWGTTWYLTPRTWILSKTIQSIDWKIGCHMKTMFQRHSNLKFPFYFHVAYLFRHHFDQPARNLSVKPCSTQEDFTPLRIALRYVKARHQEAEYHSPWDHTENAGDFFGQKKAVGFSDFLNLFGSFSDGNVPKGGTWRMDSDVLKMSLKFFTQWFDLLQFAALQFWQVGWYNQKNVTAATR